MDDAAGSYEVFERPGPMPDSEDARAFLASLLGEDAHAVTMFPVVFPPATHREAHRHTADLAVGVVSGAVTFVFGADGAGRVELSPGDYLWIGEGVMHDEESTDGVELVVAHREAFETLTT